MDGADRFVLRDSNWCYGNFGDKDSAEYGTDKVDVINITDASPADFDRYAYIIIGCPMWNIGKLVTDRDVFFVHFDHMDLTGKKIAYFSPGDQVDYGDNFQDALGILAEKCAERGAMSATGLRMAMTFVRLKRWSMAILSGWPWMKIISRS